MAIRRSDPPHLRRRQASPSRSGPSHNRRFAARRTVRTTRAGETLTYDYDPLNRITTKAIPFSGDNSGHTLSWSYTLDGRVTEIEDSAGEALESFYDSAGRQTEEIQTVLAAGGSQHVTWELDAAGNRTKLTWPDGYYAAYAYDALNHPITVTDSDGAALAAYTYDDLARRSTLHYAGTGGATVSYTWSPEDDLTGLAHDLAGGAGDVTYANGFSPAHQIVSEATSNASYVWQPPALASDSYGAVNALNQYPSVNGDALTWDSNGNLLTANGWTYGHDPENRLVHARNADGSIDLTTLSDPLGRRTAKTVAFSEAGPTRFVHAGDAEIGEYTRFGGLIRRFVPGPAIDEYIAMVQPPAEDGTPGAKTFFHANRQGSVIAMSDATGNQVEGPYTYDAYGNCFASSASCATLPAATVPFRFTGQRYDAETGLYYYRARYYAPGIGRFIETDPAGYGPDINWYTAFGNDPTDKTDPTGAQDEDPRETVGNVLGLYQFGHGGPFATAGQVQGTIQGARTIGVVTTVAVGVVAAGAACAVACEPAAAALGTAGLAKMGAGGVIGAGAAYVGGVRGPEGIATAAAIGAVTNPITSVAVETGGAAAGVGFTAVSSGIGSAAGQHTETGRIDPTGTLLSAGAGGLGYFAVGGPAVDAAAASATGAPGILLDTANTFNAAVAGTTLDVAKDRLLDKKR